MELLLIGLIIYVFLLFFRMHRLIKKYKINFKYMFLNYVMLGVVVFLNLPPVLNFLSEVFNLHNRFDVMIIVMFVYLMYNNIMLEFQIARINQDLENMVSKIALIKYDVEDK